MRDYGKVHTSFWTSSNVRNLSEDGRALAIYLLTCPHGTIAGVFRLPDGYACEDLQWDAERVKQTLSELLRNGFATRCEVTKWVWVTKHFDWNPPENPNQKKAAAKMAAQVPESCSWKAEFIGKYGEFLGIEPTADQADLKPLPNPFGTVVEPVTVAVTVAGTVDKGIGGAADADTTAKTVSVKVMVAEGVDRQKALDWLVLRKAKRLPLTPSAWDDTKAEGEKVGLTPAQTVAHAVCSNWAGFKASWYNKDHGHTAPAGGMLAGAI